MKNTLRYKSGFENVFINLSKPKFQRQVDAKNRYVKPFKPQSGVYNNTYPKWKNSYNRPHINGRSNNYQSHRRPPFPPSHHPQHKPSYKYQDDEEMYHKFLNWMSFVRSPWGP